MNAPIALLLLLLLGPAYAQVSEQDLLLPEQAFRVTATATEQGVRLEWTIAEGYYLYRDKLRVRATEPGVELGPPTLPPGEVKQDEFFGRIEIYRQRATVDVPLRRPPELATLVLEATSQGCADVGVCYPPHTQQIRVELPPPRPAPTDAAPAASAPTSSTPAGALQALARLGETLTGRGAEREFLPPDEAFRAQVEPTAAGGLVARWDIAEGYYLYRDKFQFRLLTPPGATLGQVSLPPGEPKADPTFGEVQVYHRQISADLPVSGVRPGDRLSVELQYQGCAEAGICYPPISKTLELLAPAALAAPTAQAAPPSPPVPGPAAGEPIAEQDRLAALLASDNAWLTVLAFFGFGLLLAFTPCVFPMIPILSGIIAGQGSHITARKAFVLSLIYVLAMSVTYTAAGVIAGVFGENLQATLQNPWILASFAVVFVALALSMFGFYELQLPASWQSRLAEVSNRQQGGRLLGVAVMGFLSALIVGPCVAPPLAGALIYIGQTGDPWLGGLALFALSMGMGLPLIAVGTLEGRYLPRAGGWMNAVKAVFGVALLAVAVFLLDRVLPPWLTLTLWAALFIISAIYLGALEPLGKDASGFRKLWKGAGLVMLVYGILLMVGAATGSGSLVQPLRGVAAAGTSGAAATHLAFRPVKTLADVQQQIATAGGRPVVLDFYADWCVACKEMEAFTFSDPGVQQVLSRAVLIKADVTANDAQDQDLLKAFGLFGPPALLFFAPDGNERRGYRLVGFMPAGPFRDHARSAMN
jgi:thiol:disulfide interchange protein DsbD